MPLYTYKCNNCVIVLEARQKFSDDPLTDCPNCEGGDLRRVINQVGVVFKGSGFYVNDTKSKNPAAKTNNDKSAESSSDSSESGSSDSSSSAGGAETKSEKKESSSPKPAASTE